VDIFLRKQNYVIKSDYVPYFQGTLDWSTAQQARLFGATFYGSFLTVFISGYLSDRFGTKLLIGLAMADYSLVSLLSPLFVSLDYHVFFVARLFMGFGEVKKLKIL
jgi:MFS family permease